MLSSDPRLVYLALDIPVFIWKLFVFRKSGTPPSVVLSAKRFLSLLLFHRWWYPSAGSSLRSLQRFTLWCKLLPVSSFHSWYQQVWWHWSRRWKIADFTQQNEPDSLGVGRFIDSRKADSFRIGQQIDLKQTDSWISASFSDAVRVSLFCTLCLDLV